jgi:charged multivesicular body protein 2A
MAQAMKGVTKAMTKMNQKVNLPGLQKIMTDFMRENEKSEVTQEMIGDTLDDAMAEEGSEEQEDLIVGQVLDELGINMTDSVPSAPEAKEQPAAVATGAAAVEDPTAAGKLAPCLMHHDATTPSSTI